MDDPTAVLGLPPGASREQIERAYRTLVRRYPPELNPARFARIHQAYERLRSFEHAMEEAWKMPAEILAALFPVPHLTLRPAESPPAPPSLEDLEVLLRPLRRAALAERLREAFAHATEGEAAGRT
jgi:hypothetical protein